MRYFLSCLLALWFIAPVRAETPAVVVSIKPLHSLVAAVMQGDGQTPLLLVDGKNSLHSFSLRPSQMQALEHARIIFYIDERFETFLGKALEPLPGTVRRAKLSQTPRLTWLPVRLNSAEPHTPDAHDHVHDSGRDFHLWLLPDNASVLVMEIARQLSIVFPDKRALYFVNARQAAMRLAMLDRLIEQRMSRLAGKPFAAFHDAYQYFEKRYELPFLGALTLHPERGMSAGHVRQLREKVKETGAACVFREPQFEAQAVESLLEDTGARSGVLDPEGALLPPGPELYFQLIEALAANLEDCLLPRK
jgi:zinc transport system substrate-binding protein